MVKRLIGYKVPDFNEPEVSVLPGKSNLPFLNISDGFEIDIFAENLEDPRVIAFDPAGNMLVSETKAGRVVMLKDSNGDGKSDQKTVILDGLRSPHGLDFYTDPKTKTTYLYIAETNQVARFPYNVKTGQITSKNGENIVSLPPDGEHFTRTIAFGPNYRQAPIIGGFKEGQTLSSDKLYVSVGSSCDVCVEDSWKRAAILESDPGGSYTAEFAGGLRNSVFFTFHPKTKEIWATEMGRDNLGDNLPPDEINIIKVAGPEDQFGAKRYGWPFCYGNKVRDEKFNPDKIDRTDISSDCNKTVSPAIQIPAHSAPLGITFINNKKWPPEWQNDLLIAFHGSWNRSEPLGYEVVRYDLDADGNVLSQKPIDFITGWLNSSTGSGQDKIYGRPVDLKFRPDGTLFISDDTAGVIYRVSPR